MAQKAWNRSHKEFVMAEAVVMLSGGLDSTVAMLKAMNELDDIIAVSFNYGQFHAEELKQAEYIAKAYNVPWECVQIRDVFSVAESSLLTGLGLNERSIKNNALPSSFVPGRNIMLVTAAAIYAYKNDAHQVWAGFCGDDAGEYPDCEPEFVNALEQTIRFGFADPDFSLRTPLIYLSKSDIFEEAQLLDSLGFVLEHTHTCYSGMRGPAFRHKWGYGCGECPSCSVRKYGWDKYIEDVWNGGEPFDCMLNDEVG